MNNCPFKYFGNLRETHTLNEYLVTSVRASSLLSNFIDVTTALMKENISYNLYKEEFRTIEYFCEPLYCSLRVGVSFPPSSFSFFSLSLFCYRPCFRMQLLCKCPLRACPDTGFFPISVLQRNENPCNSFAMQINARNVSSFRLL